MAKYFAFLTKTALVSSIALMLFLFSCLAYPTDDERLRKEFIDHRLDLLENGFNTFANEVFPTIEKIQKKVQFVSETNKELSHQLKDLESDNAHLLEMVESQDSTISDLLWAVSDLKLNGLSIQDQNLLSEIEWTVFDLKHSTLKLMEEMCVKEVMCSEWSEWSTCSVSCGAGSSSRSRDCSNTGKFKSYCQPVLSERRACTARECIISLPSPLDCPDNYVSYQGYCFRFSSQRASRLVASMNCEIEEAHLAQIDSQEKQGVVIDYLQSVFKGQTDSVNDSDIMNTDDQSKIAIDGMRFSQETDYLNWKEKKMDFFQWAIGQPRNAQSDGDYCITLSLTDNKWYLECCTKRFYYICEAPEGGIY